MEGDPLGQGPTEGLEPGSDPDAPNGQGAGTPPASTPDRVAELERENHRLREERRTDRAKALVAEHSLPKSYADTLKFVPADQQEEAAKKLAEEIGSAPKPEPVPEPPTVPDDAAAIQALGDAPPSPSASTIQPPVTPTDELRQRIQGATSLADIERIQEEMRQKQG